MPNPTSFPDRITNVDFWAGRITALIKLAEHYGMTVEIAGGDLVVSRQVSEVFTASAEVQWQAEPLADEAQQSASAADRAAGPAHLARLLAAHTDSLAVTIEGFTGAAAASLQPGLRRALSFLELYKEQLLTGQLTAEMRRLLDQLAAEPSGDLIEDYLRFQRGQGPEPDLSDLAPEQREAVTRQFEIVRALADRDPSLPPFGRDPVARRLGLHAPAAEARQPKEEHRG